MSKRKTGPGKELSKQAEEMSAPFCHKFGPSKSCNPGSREVGTGRDPLKRQNTSGGSNGARPSYEDNDTSHGDQGSSRTAAGDHSSHTGKR